MLYWISLQRGSYDNVSIVLVDLCYSPSSMRQWKMF